MSANEAEAETQRLREQCRSLTVALEGVNIHIRNLLKGAVTGQFDGVCHRRRPSTVVRGKRYVVR